jgi:6-pyruvoyltetrahydropterin/6-carboxytetrahydropterin synthase
MVIDFKDLKTIVKSEIVDVFDHAMVLNNNSPHSELATILSSQEHKVIRVDYQPTSENMVIDFANRIASKLPSHIKLFKVRLNETATAYAEWYASDQE